ncbi:MAG: hypothetical protein AAB403_07290, partial [Planctomycetota bacterium]
MVAVAPAYDQLTSCFSRWLLKALTGIDCILFVGDSAERSRFLASLGGDKSTLVVLFGHGTDDAFFTSPELGLESD